MVFHFFSANGVKLVQGIYMYNIQTWLDPSRNDSTETE